MQVICRYLVSESEFGGKIHGEFRFGGTRFLQSLTAIPGDEEEILTRVANA